MLDQVVRNRNMTEILWSYALIVSFFLGMFIGTIVGCRWAAKRAGAMLDEATWPAIQDRIDE